jgi:hypothetical protein
MLLLQPVLPRLSKRWWASKVIAGPAFDSDRKCTRKCT